MKSHRASPELVYDRLESLIILDRSETGISLSIDRALSASFVGLTVHHGLFRSLVGIAMRQSGGRFDRSTMCCHFAIGQGGLATELVSELKDIFARVANMPVSAKQAEKLLGITAAERTRWTKAGLLATSGTATFSRGNAKVTLPTYAPSVLEMLQASPSTIAQWRQRDADMGLARV